jgi:hypothetical protein
MYHVPARIDLVPEHEGDTMPTLDMTKGHPSVPSGPPWGNNLTKLIERTGRKIPIYDNTQGVIDA